MKTYNERTESILRKTEKKKKQRKMIKRTAIAALSLAALTAVNLVLFTPYQVETPSVAKYKNSEYYTVIRTLNEMTAVDNAPKYKNNYEKWTDGLGDFLSGMVGCGGNKAAGGDMMAGDPTNEGIDIWYDAEMAPGAAEGEADSPNDATEEGSSNAGEYVETTDNQVAGVIEGDLFKRTTSHIFYLDIRSDIMYIRVFSIAGASSEQVNVLSVDLQGGNRAYDRQPQIYLSSDGTRLTVLTTVAQYQEDETAGRKKTERYTLAIGYDVSDPENMTEAGRTYLTGDFISSRMTDGSLLLINSFTVANDFDFEDKTTYLPHYGTLENMQPVAGEDIVCPENSTLKRYTVVCEIDPVTFAVSDCTALFSHTSEAYVSAENIFVTRSYTEREDISAAKYLTVSKTEISCVYYGGDGLEYKGAAIVDGTVKNQYSMDEYNGILRVATTNTEQTNTKRSYGDYWSSSTERAGSLYCIDLTTFETVASVEKFIENETVESVRFDKDKAYICTAVVITLTDPVFAFDLSDLNNITYVDTGVIDGYSTSLVNFTDGYLLGIGYGASGGLKMEIYAETDEKMESVCAYEIDGDFSEDYKSYYIDRERGLVGLCTYEYREEGFYSWLNIYRLLQFDGYGFTELATVVMSDYQNLSLVRATLIEDHFYIIGPGEHNFFVVEI